MIEIEHLVKRYGSKFAVDDISFRVNRGEIVGFLGPNGAGKSTTLNILTGYLSSTSGTVRVSGIDVLDSPYEAKRLIGFLPEQPPLYVDMKVDEYLGFIYELKRCTLNREKHLKEVCEVTKISDVRGRMIKNLSKGYRQRVGIAQSLIGNPPVLVFDEPTVGLDPKQIIEIRELIRKLSKEHTVILSSHILAEVQEVCDHILIIHHGKLIASGTPAELERSLGASSLKVTVRSVPFETLKATLSGLDGIISIAPDDAPAVPGETTAVLKLKSNVDLREAAFKACVDAGMTILMLHAEQFSLETIFLELTRGNRRIVRRKKQKAEPAEDVSPADSGAEKEYEA
jgi:ABC-2 type transport system ATP-binding protein